MRRSPFLFFCCAGLILSAFLVGIVAVQAKAEPSACEGPRPCMIGDRSYQDAPPPDWNGEDPLPVLIHLHGWGRNGEQVLRNARIADAAARQGVLLIAPNGIGRSWDFWDDDSRDVPFVDRVLADVGRRWPIDRDRVFISGFSYGAAMAWRIACARGRAFAGYLSIAGTLWGQDRLACPGGPARVAHVHGLKDNVMAPPDGTLQQPAHAVAYWLKTNGCALDDVNRTRRGDFDRYTWQACANGPSVSLDLHPGGHWIPKTWLDRTLGELLAETTG